MTDEQINAAIAEVCGRRRNPKGGWYPGNGWEFGTQGILNYCADLNAMHEAERVLTKAQWQEFVDDLAEGWGSVSDAWKDVCHATARQRAEAFLRTLGKWEEVRND